MVHAAAAETFALEWFGSVVAAFLVLVLALLFAVQGHCADHPVFDLWPPDVDESDIDTYLAPVEPLLDMGEDEMLEIIPVQAGLYHAKCQNCEAGYQDGQFAADWRPTDIEIWNIEQPDQMRCKYCGHVYPSEEYPMDQAVEVQNPFGETHTYPYHMDKDGHRQFFAARIDLHRLRYMEDAARNFAYLYHITGDRQYARRAALIVHRFAQVYPRYCYHRDRAFGHITLYNGEPPHDERVVDYRVAKWGYWAYLEISRDLLQAYDHTAASGVYEDISKEHETDAHHDIRAFFEMVSEDVISRHDPLGNMSPGMWSDFIRVGRIFERPEYVHVAVQRLRELFAQKFFYDGAWEEGAPSYHRQVMGGLSSVFYSAKGYSDPPDYAHPDTGERFDDLEIAADFPMVQRSQGFVEDMKLPDGSEVPVHDTWAQTRGEPRQQQAESFIYPALGHACLARGYGDDQTQVHLTWSPGYGHRHYDGLSMILYANGKELLSDIGYTHTKARGWTLASASHNTVLVDMDNQQASGRNQSTYGSLRYMDMSNPHCQLVSVDNPEVYPQAVDRYRRTLALVAIDDTHSYVLDWFQVRGGELHDYFLHGCADEPGTVGAGGGDEDVGFVALQSLLPEGFEFEPPNNEGDTRQVLDRGYAYRFLYDLQQATMEDGATVTLEYGFEDQPVGLRTHLLVEAGDSLVRGENWSVRHADENDANLDDHMRPFGMLRRQGAASDFVSVLEPFDGAPMMDEVSRVEMEGAQSAVEVVMGNRTDFILMGASGVDAAWQGEALQADCELAVLSIEGGQPVNATVVGGSVSWAGTSLDSGRAVTRSLVDVDAETGTLVVEGEMSVPAGSVITLGHGGERVSAYTVEQTSMEGANTVIAIRQPPGFTYDPAAETSTFEYVPHLTYEGPHTVTFVPVAHSQMQ